MLFDLMDGIGKGYSVVEIMWDQSEGQWTPREYIWRDPRFFVFDRDTGQELRLLDEGASYEGRSLPPFKFLVHRPKIKSGLTLRSGLARLAATAFMCKGFTLTDWMAFAEVFGMPLRVGRYGQGASDEDIATLKRAVANLASDAAAAIPDSMRIEFVEAGKAAGGHVLFENLGNFLDRQMSKAVLGQTMTTDDGASLSQASVHNEIRIDIKRDDGGQAAATVNRDLIKPFVDLNYGPPKNGYPRVQLLVAEPEDVKALSDALGILVPMGLKVAASEVRDKLNLRDPGEDEELLGMPAVGIPAAANRRTALPRAVNRAVGPQWDDTDQLAADALADWQPLMRPVIDPVLELAERAGSFDAFQAGLEELAGQMDSTELVKSLALATFRARAHGDVED
jgi:phage gp29-like protein